MKKTLYSLGLLLLTLTACRKDAAVVPEEVEQVSSPSDATSFFLLNEGNMNMNKASLDRFDAATGAYRRNIFEASNPDVIRGLGDVGNDIKAYGSKLYVVVNISNKVEVLDLRTARRISKIDIPNCRYVSFDAGKAYVSSYEGAVGNTNKAEGSIVRIDTATLSIEARTKVGRQPEEIAIVGRKLYVANSGGYNPTNYERSVSVVDLNSFQEIKRIDVADNLHRVRADQYGDVYVSSRGDYYGTPSNLFVIDTRTDQVKKVFDVSTSNIWIDGDLGYVYSLEWDYTKQRNTVNYSIINVRDETLVEGSFIKDGTEKNITKPFGIAVDPKTKDIYVSDAKDYLSPGTLYCFDKNGIKKWSVITGDIPAHIAFIGMNK
ncbi:MAG: YncE family protein [Arcticibacter sp.]